MANTDKQHHEPRGTVVANKSSLTVQQQFTLKVEQTCSGSYMHELQQGCSHQRRISVCSPQPSLKKKKEKKKESDTKVKCLVKIDFQQCAQRHQHRNTAESHKVPPFISTSVTLYHTLFPFSPQNYSCIKVATCRFLFSAVL